jgi:hypothetical protein
MTHGGMRRINKNYGDSPGRRSSVPIASSRLASSTRGTASRLPFGSAVESWPPQPSACPRPSPHAVPRVDDASREPQRAMKHRALRERLGKCAALLVVGVAGKKLSEHLTERCSRVQLREHRQPTQPDTMDQQIARWQVQLHCHPT